MSVIHTNIATKPAFATAPKADIIGTFQFWMGRAKQRRQLAELPEERLADMGITPTQALAESAKPFWQD